MSLYGIGGTGEDYPFEAEIAAVGDILPRLFNDIRVSWLYGTRAGEQPCLAAAVGGSGKLAPLSSAASIGTIMWRWMLP